MNLSTALFPVLFAGPFCLHAEMIQVGPTAPYNSLQEAISQAHSNDTIRVQAGTYLEHDILIDKPLTIVGEGNPVIDAKQQGYVLKIQADDIHISGLTLRNVGQSYTKDYAAIYISKSQHFTIEKMTLEKVFFGILVEKSKHGVIADNHVFGEFINEAGAGNGIHAWHSSNLLIKGNNLHNLRDGIYFEFVKKSWIEKNHSHDNLRYGLHFMFSNHDAYLHNTFSQNGAGVAVMFSKFITMKKNTFDNNWGSASYGLLLKEIYDAEIEDNTFNKNTIGIHVDGSTRINYLRNTFWRNGWAIRVAGACYKNRFEQNDFLYNAFDLSYHSKLNDNVFDGNYWSEYSGYDLDRDGVGDVPYRPVKLFSYIVHTTPEALILLRSLFVDIVNFSEKISPVFTPDDLLDHTPATKQINDSTN